MLKSLHIKNFKSLRDIQIEFGKLNIFIGANASGKSNVFDALRVLQGIGNGFTISEIFDGKPKSATSEIWEGIRGGSRKAVFKDQLDVPISFQLESTISGSTKSISYEIDINADRLKTVGEFFSSDDLFYDSEDIIPPRSNLYVKYYAGKKGKQPNIGGDANFPILTHISKKHDFLEGKERLGAKCFKVASDFTRSLANTQRIDPSPSILRSYSQAQNINRMGEHGENFAALIQTICDNSQSKEAFLSWLKQLRPSEVEDIGIIKGALGEPMFCLKESEQEFPAPTLSDGTLRFAAIAAAFFQPDMPELLTVEEIENGIHASRLRLLVELLRSRSKETQVIVTTHSPVILDWLKEEEYAHVFFFKRDESTGESKITPLSNIPNFDSIAKKQPIGDLFEEGWMEAVL